ncbi:hypothetical protein PCANB_001041 [Pneumocystis canis]|nr:hypothetical protein PCANB_001041 [Pneumocystis canis]
MMSGILKEWIRGKVRQSLSTITENPIKLNQNQRVQFLTYENPVFAEVSDMETFICCEFTKECVEIESGKRFTQIKGSYLTLKNMQLQIYEASNFAVSVRLIVPKIQFLGGEGEAIVGHPIFFTEHQEIGMLLRSPKVQGYFYSNKNLILLKIFYRFLWPPLSVEKAGTNISDEIRHHDNNDRLSNELTDKQISKKKHGFWSTHTIEYRRDKQEEKKQRVLHPGWRGFSEITYHDCIISDDQQKTLKRDESWYPPIDLNLSQQETFTSQEIITSNASKFYKETVFNNSSPESTFSWEESPIINKSSTFITKTKSNNKSLDLSIEKKEFFSDNDTLPPSSPSTITHSPLLHASLENNLLNPKQVL